jgi:hypothetical protein
MTKNQKLAKEAIKLAEREIKEWTKFLKLAKKILEEESGYTCPFCGWKKSSPEVICKCEVENTGMDEFWKY